MSLLETGGISEEDKSRLKFQNAEDLWKNEEGISNLKEITI